MEMLLNIYFSKIVISKIFYLVKHKQKTCMIRTFFTIAILSIFALASHAQIRVGATAGISSTGVSSDKLEDFLDDNPVGFYVGPTAEFMFNSNLGVDLSALYSQKGIKFKGEKTNRVGYIEIPLNAKYLLPLNDYIKVFAGAGPYINFKISGDKNFDVLIDEVKGQWDSKSFGAGLNFKGGIEIYKFIQVGTNYSLGLTDNFKASNGNYSAKERVWSLYASAYF